MKKRLSAVIAIMLVFSMIFSGASAMGASAAADAEEALTHVGLSALEGIVKGLLVGLCAIVPDSKNLKKLSEHVTEDFFKGTESFLDSPAENARWNLGYAKASLVPDDILEPGTEYYLGGFMTIDNGMNNKIEEVIDDMQVRIIALSDGSARGVTIFANVDCIGFCNDDIKTVRRYLKDLCPDVTFNAVNVTSTHCHSCIDTQGLWTDTFKKIFTNLFKSYIPFLDKERGVNVKWIDDACKIIANSMKSAVNDMKPGTMTYAVKTLNKEYFSNRNRKSSTSLCSDMSRFVFKPDDGSTPTMMVNIAAHPDVVGLATSDKQDNGRQLSGDYVYYLGEGIEKAGYNFMFINGAIAGIYYGRGLTNDGVDTGRRYGQAVRYGHEMAAIALNLTNTYDEISANADWDTINKEKAEGGDGYSLWFEGWEPVEERELEPLFNIRLKEIQLEVNNPLILLVGKLDLTCYKMYKEGLKYYMFSEIGYAQFGDVRVAMVPGELVQDVMYGGGSLTAAGSFKGKDFGYPCIRDSIGKDAICFGLCNDAIGYIVPDNDYSLAIAGDHYQELISLGDKTASAVAQGFAELADELKLK
ncbi:MAG: hypothetical protein J5870_02375 [Clostridia bacterium]|nr:hypothetical protein [Clostridia bacterium]